MRLTEKNLELRFVPDKNDSAEDKSFLTIMDNYKMVRHGAGIFFYRKTDDQLMMHFKPFDNTQLIMQPDAYQLASLFGTKRFPIGKARVEFNPDTVMGATKFDRDLSFPLKKKLEMQKDHPYKVVNLKSLLEIKKHNTYLELAKLFDDCADFTPGKQYEYLTGGSQQDKLCRFNLESTKRKDNLETMHVFLIDEENDNKIIGTISATIRSTRRPLIDVYVYDEIVDYFSLLSVEKTILVHDLTNQLNTLNDKSTQTEKDKENIVQIKKALTDIIEPARSKLMGYLFSAAQESIQQKIIEMQPQLRHQLGAAILTGHISAVIRAAAGRIESYTKLGCTNANPGHYVIHGPQSNYAKMLDKHVKEWARKELTLLHRSLAKKDSTNSYYYLGAAAAVGIGMFAAYKMISGDSTPTEMAPTDALNDVINNTFGFK